MKTPWTAIILTGGTSSRLGEDKSRVRIGEHTTLQRIVQALQVEIIVVGPEDQGLPVQLTREVPIGSGPAAGLAAALPLVETDVVGVLATDMPFAVPILCDLIENLPRNADGLLAVDSNGRDQYLCAVYRTSALRMALMAGAHDRSMKSVVATMSLDRLPIRDDARLLDIDTPEDLEEAQCMEANNASVD